MNDSEIIELYFQRDEQAIKETDSRYGGLCHHIAYNILNENKFKQAYNILNNKEDAEECVSDAYVGVWNAIPPARPDNFMAFVSRITRNLSLKKLEFITRDKRSRDMSVSLEELEAVLPDERCVKDITGEELGSAISRFLRGQKAEARNVFIRKYYFFDSVKEIAARYSFTESKVKNMLLHTRKKLRDYLVKEDIWI